VNFKPTPKQALLIWGLLITKEEPAISKVKPKLSPTERVPLERLGIITLEKRGASKHIVLTDKAWDWASEHFDVELSKSASAVPVLEKLLSAIGVYLRTRKTTLADFFSSQNLSESTPSANDLELRVRGAYLTLSGGEFDRRVRLSQLRQTLNDIPRSEMDQILLRLGRNGKLVLMRFDDPQEIGSEDEQAALTSGGQENHIIYMKDW
jgi:hypothetical protein